MLIFAIKILKRFFKYFFLPVLILASIWGSYFLLYGNFHKVDNDVYRSAQLFSFNMPHYIEKHNIKSIINLRGKSNKTWYKDELKISDEYNITHYDYGIGDREVQTVATMTALLMMIKNAPKPLLIHCKAGADRTSLGSALYLYDKEGDANPSKGFSLLYGHFPWLGSKTVAMDKSFQIYKEKNPKQ